MRLRHGAAIGESAPVAGVEVALGRQALGQQHIVRRQFHVPVADFFHRTLADVGAVDEMADRDQVSAHIHGVVRRQQQIAPRQACAEPTMGPLHRVLHRRRV